MFFFLLYNINSVIFDYTIPRIFDTVYDYAEYNPNLYNYDIIHKEFNTRKCLNSTKRRLDECVDFSIKKFYNPFSVITKNNPKNDNFFQFFEGKNKYFLDTEEKTFAFIISFWLKCAQKGNKKCAELYDTFNFFQIDNYPEEYFTEQNESNTATIFSQLKEAHYLMYNIQYPKMILQAQNNTIQRTQKSNKTEQILKDYLFLNLSDYFLKNEHQESESEREIRFKKAYDILKPIAFLAFDKYINDHFGFLRPLHRFNLSLVENMLGYRRAYQHELKILLEGKEITKNPSWMFGDLIYPEVARLFNDILTRREEGPEKPLNKIYSDLLCAKYPYLFEEGFNDKKKYINDNKIKYFKTKEKNNDDNLKSFIEEIFQFSPDDIDVDNLTESSDEQNVFYEYDDENDDFDFDFTEEKSESIENVDDVYYEFYYNYDDESIENNTIQHSYIYDYYFNNTKKTNDHIIVKKCKKSRINFENIDSDNTNNYVDTAKMRLRHAFNLCRNYLNEIEDIESINQTNLTTSIATIYGISSLFHQEEAMINQDEMHRQILKQIHMYDQYDINKSLISCKLIDEGLYYLIVAAKNNGTKAAEALLYKFLRVIENSTQNIIDDYFNNVIYSIDQSLNIHSDDSFGSQQPPPNIYTYFHNRFSPLVADFFDAIIFFDNKSRNLFHVAQIDTFNVSLQSNISSICNETNENLFDKINQTKSNKFTKINDADDTNNVYKNPRNWKYEDAAKALRAFIDSSILMQSGHLAEISLSYHSAFLALTRDISRYLFNDKNDKKIGQLIIDYVSNFFSSDKKSENDKDDDDVIIVNNIEMNKRSFYYALKIYQTLAMSGNRDAMWNTQMLLKATNKPSQIFTMFITDSNETVFLHELDARHRRQQKDKISNEKVNSIDSKEDIKSPEKTNIESNRSVAFCLWNLILSFTSFLIALIRAIIITILVIINKTSNNTSNLHSNQIDYDFYEEISDRDPYASFSLAWKKRGNLTAAFELLDQTERMKPEAKVAVIISKLIITALAFINSIFSDHQHVSNINNVNTSSNNFIQRVFSPQKYERLSQFVISTPYLPEILLGLGILTSLAFLIYIRISLYCD